MDCLLEACTQYLAAGNYEQARLVTTRISNFLMRRGIYGEVERLNQDLLTYQEHPDPMLFIGRAYMERGNYPAARRWSERSLEVAGEVQRGAVARAWHQLATLDLRQGNYGAAQEKFQKALAMRQELGDRAGFHV